MLAMSNGRLAAALPLVPTGSAFCVRSLSVAAALKACGAAYLGPVLCEGGWVIFPFDNAGGDVPRLIAAYWAGELPAVQPRDLAAALIELRTEIRALKAAAHAGEQVTTKEGV